MRNRYLLAGVMAAVLPGAALAQPADPACVQSNHNSRVEGTVLGGVAGALIGGALGHGAGAAVGGLTGAVAGNTIAGKRNDPCPSGYYYAPPQGPPPPGYAPPPPAYGQPGYAPQGYAQPGYRQPGYAQPGYAQPGYGPPQGGFWAAAPGDIRQRIDFMQTRIQQAVDNGQLSHQQTRRAYRELGAIRTSAHDLYERDGGLNPPDRDYIQSRLDTLGQRLHFMERTGY